MDDIEREVILRTLAANEGNKTATAEVLGISRRCIYNKLAALRRRSGDDERSAEPPPSTQIARIAYTPLARV